MGVEKKRSSNSQQPSRNNKLRHLEARDVYRISKYIEGPLLLILIINLNPVLATEISLIRWTQTAQAV